MGHTFEGMKRWMPWFAMPVIFAILIVMNHRTGAILLEDTDTRVLLEAIAKRNQPLSWFFGDWPLENHFYRPISTLFFEFDSRVHGWSPAGFGLTNALICAICVLLCFWVVREITQRDWVAGLSSSLFGLWHIAYNSLDWAVGALWIVAALSLIGLLRGGKGRLWLVSIGFFALVYAAMMLYLPGGGGVPGRVMNWIPGRTATSMTIFCLLAMGAWGRYLNFSSTAKAKAATSTDLPATKGTASIVSGRAGPWLWGSGLASLLALGAYEQAVMLAGVMTGMMILKNRNGFQVRWLALGVPWGTLIGYMVLRSAILPAKVSGYQAQQFRNGPSVFWDLVEFFAPMIRFGRDIFMSFEAGFLLWFTAEPWKLVILFIANVVGVWVVWKDRDRWPILFAQAAAIISFLPMAWLKYFGHYLYWPMMFWAMYVIMLVPAMFRRWVIAVSPQEIQAPLRSDRGEHSPLHP